MWRCRAVAAAVAGALSPRLASLRSEWCGASFVPPCLIGPTPHTCCRPQWMGAAVKMTDELVSSVQGKKAAAGSRAAATLAAGGKRGKRQAEKKRR